MKISNKFYGLTLAVTLTCFAVSPSFAHLEGDVPPPQCKLTALDGKKVEDWTSNDFDWMKDQISFISRMKGSRGPLFDEKGRKTRKLLSLLVWGHDPRKKINEEINDVYTSDFGGSDSDF